MDKLQDFEAILKENQVEISENFKKFLKNAGYFDLPASVKHHLAYEGGLFDHSMNVANALVLLTKQNDLTWSRQSSPVIVGLFHDLCKVEAYQVDNSEPYVVGEPTRFQYKRNENQLYTGHGEKSVLMLAEFMDLTGEEIACIRWHMGAFDTKKSWKHYTAAVHKYHNVLWTHHADMIATHILEQ